jgi:hypothetical protein
LPFIKVFEIGHGIGINGTLGSRLIRLIFEMYSARTGSAITPQNPFSRLIGTFETLYISRTDCQYFWSLAMDAFFRLFALD